ncbi:unnamed protein product [Adineta ricciae]|uniref:Uncharacterized protein n=1 Tax=Adineta ricciae TaxID=249248 RepID=A0A814FKK5_ADIRI|nr:unnamed protein product [Adineta ricciae]CAF1252298.1 unnamed protein product [Adineta ricciae]
MSAPTGMGQNTAAQWHNVAGQLHAYVNNNGGQQLHAASGRVQQFQPTRGPAYASHVVPHSQYRMSAYPSAQYPTPDDFARGFLRNLFKP